MNRRAIFSSTLLGMTGLVTGNALAQESPSREDYVTLDGVETLSNKTFAGPLSVHTDGARIGITSDTKSVDAKDIGALMHVRNLDTATCAIRGTSYWAGSTHNPFQNNDCSLWEVFNDTLSDSLNRSWAGSFANAYNRIPAGVTDTGTRVGVIGWAVSVDNGEYLHEGTLAQQTGVQGSAGFQSAGSGPSAVIQKASGVYGVIYTGSEGATIEEARAGEFSSIVQVGKIEDNTAVYAEASGGEKSNYSFFGAAGYFFNSDRAYFGTGFGQSNAQIYARTPKNSIEFGHPDPGGYVSTIGATPAHGYPFIAFCAEADAKDGFATRGNPGTVIWNDTAGSLVISRVPDPNAAGQTSVESARFDAGGHLHLAKAPYLPSGTPASASAPGQPGEISWDADFVYVCIAENTWRRAALAGW